MFIVLLKFSDSKKAGQFAEGHRQWLGRGFEEGVFLLAGSLQPGKGGVIIAHNTSLPELEIRVNEDPFVKEDIVAAEIIEISPSRTDERLNFLLAEKGPYT